MPAFAIYDFTIFLNRYPAPPPPLFFGSKGGGIGYSVLYSCKCCEDSDLLPLPPVQVAGHPGALWGWGPQGSQGSSQSTAPDTTPRRRHSVNGAPSFQQVEAGAAGAAVFSPPRPTSNRRPPQDLLLLTPE